MKVQTVHIAKKVYAVVLYVFAFLGFLFVGGYFAIKFGLTKNPGIIDAQTATFLNAPENILPWTNGREWETLEAAILADRGVIMRAAEDTDTDPRLIVAQLVAEQLRLYHSNRELFKKVFYPLKILGNQSQFSWGILGIKKETAIAIEQHLQNPTSEFYIGKEYERLLDFSSADSASGAFSKNH